MNHPLKITVLMIVAFSWFFFPIACSKKDSPTQPSDSGPSTPTGPIIVGSIIHTDSFDIANATVSDSTGNTGTTNTGVTVFSNGVTIPLVSGSLLDNTSSVTIIGAPYITGNHYSASITYTAGQVYTFKVVVASETYSGSVTGITGNPIIQPSSGTAGVTCSWNTGVGNTNHIDFDPPIASIGPPISSNPFTIPNSVFSNETPGTGNDVVNLDVVQFSASAFPSAQTSSCLISSNVASTHY
jgi:hypothetical protein